MITADPLPTFRDPAGFLTLEAEGAIRTIHPSGRTFTLKFLNSPFYRRLRDRGDVIDAVIEDSPAGLRLIHPLIQIPTYPWEWTPSQWQAAAHLTLTLCEEAVPEGWILKDATPLNILFVNTRPILVDVLSFEPYALGSSLWAAYGQFIRTFLLPLVMRKLLHWPLALSLFHRDGYEPAKLYSILGWRHRLSRSAFWPVTLPVWLERSARDSEPGSSAERASGTGSQARLDKNLKDLRRRIDQVMIPESPSTWSDYPHAAHYTPEQKRDKLDWLRRTVSALQPARTLDLGANMGEYSALVASMGLEVIAVERDEAAAERLFCMSRDQNLPIQTIHADLARPTPAVGWENRESLPLLDRLTGKCDLVMLLAVVHHLILIDQIPLPAILRLCARLTRRSLILEWVPPADPMFQALLRGRGELYGGLSEADLHAACRGLFDVRRQHTLGNGRVLFVLERTVCPL